MTYGLDTSVVLRLLTDTTDPLTEKARERIAELLVGGNTFFISDLVASETYYALQHHYGNTKEEAITALRAMAQADGFAFSPEATNALGAPDIWSANPGFVDRMLAGEYAAKGQVTLSCEKAFRKLDLTEIIRIP